MGCRREPDLLQPLIPLWRLGGNKVDQRLYIPRSRIHTGRTLLTFISIVYLVGMFGKLSYSPSRIRHIEGEVTNRRDDRPAARHESQDSRQALTRKHEHIAVLSQHVDPFFATLPRFLWHPYKIMIPHLRSSLPAIYFLHLAAFPSYDAQIRIKYV